jgi:hypothetical protein
MADQDKLVPRTPNEVVVPIGKANLVTTQEEIDQALETASHIFRKQNKEKVMEETNLNTELETSLENSENFENDTNEEALVELSAEELADLPAAKFGRDNFGRALNKNGTPRKARNDKGVERGKYGPRTQKNNLVDETPVLESVATAIENTNADDSPLF